MSLCKQRLFNYLVFHHSPYSVMDDIRNVCIVIIVHVRNLQEWISTYYNIPASPDDPLGVVLCSGAFVTTGAVPPAAISVE